MSSFSVESGRNTQRPNVIVILTDVPFFVRWTGKLTGGRNIDRIAAHIDLTPTLLEACQVPTPAGVNLDGKSLWPLLKGEPIDWPDRTLYFQWHRGDEPELYRAFAARSQGYKLVQPLGASTKPPGAPVFKLSDMTHDPLELHDIASDHADIVRQMREGCVQWFNDVGRARGFAPPRIHLGAPQENPTTLTRQDWRGPKASWGRDAIGYREADITHSGAYEIVLPFAALRTAGIAHLSLGGVKQEKEFAKGATTCRFHSVSGRSSPGRLETWIVANQESTGVQIVEVKRLD